MLRIYGGILAFGLACYIAASAFVACVSPCSEMRWVPPYATSIDGWHDGYKCYNGNVIDTP